MRAIIPCFFIIIELFQEKPAFEISDGEQDAQELTFRWNNGIVGYIGLKTRETEATKETIMTVLTDNQVAFTEKMKLSTQSDMLIRTLIDMYKDSLTAIIREYSANALDSHIVAGQTRPIEVTLPHYENGNILTIQDFGLGLDEEGLRKYVCVGDSSKRPAEGDESVETVSSDVPTGSFGMGSKSGLSLASSVSLIAVKDGIKRHVEISESDDGGIFMNALKVEETNDENGLTVFMEIPESHAYLARSKAEALFNHWDEGTVLVDGAEPVKISTYEGYRAVGNAHIWDHEKSYRSSPTFKVKMGSVAYDVDKNLLESSEIVSAVNKLSMNNHNLMLSVPVRSMDLVLNRDSIIYSPKTVKTLHAAIESFVKNLSSDIDKEVSDHLDKGEVKEAALLYMKFKSAVPLTVPTIDDVRFDMFVRSAQNDTDGSPVRRADQNRIVTAKRDYRGNMVYAGRRDVSSYVFLGSYEITKSNMDSTHVIYVDDMNMYTRVIRNAKAYLEATDATVLVFAIGEYEYNPWVMGTVHSISYEEFYEVARAYIRRNRGQNNRRNQAPPITYPVYISEEGDSEMLNMSVEDILELGDDFYHYKETSDGRPNTGYMDKLMEWTDYKPVIFVAENKKTTALIKRLRHANAVSLKDSLKEKVNAFTDEDFIDMYRGSISNRGDKFCNVLKDSIPPNRLHELGEVAEMIAKRDEIKNKAKEKYDLMLFAHSVSFHTITMVDTLRDRWENAKTVVLKEMEKGTPDDILLAKYPMLGFLEKTYWSLQSHEIERVIEYIKMVENG